MKTSLHWLNQYLSRPIEATEAERLLTDQGFPIETIEPTPDGSTMLDVEVTSNRGDCLSHVGVAREIAAGSDRQLREPDSDLPGGASAGPDINTLLQVVNDVPALCPIYTARVIQGVKVGPSPKWLVDALQAVGLRSVNNVVDVTNFVLLELGQPLHAFDMARLKGHKVVVRLATAGEPFDAIDGSKHKLNASMLVIADETHPVAVAGVMGGLDSEVSTATTDIVLESAMFSSMSVRQTSRTLKLMSDSSYRFERGVDPQGVDRASRRAAGLILELAGGTLAKGVIVAGKLPAAPPAVTLRVARCNTLLGLNLTAQRMMEILDSLSMQPLLDAPKQVITCTIPSHRLDLYREVDLIEEVARLAGFDGLAVQDRIQIQARAPQPHIVARRKLDQVLVAHGYFETINFSFLTPQQAQLFVGKGHEAISIDDDRRKREPTLRPSLLPSLLHCRKANQDAGNADVRLFEIASTWTRAQTRPEPQTIEKRRLALLADAPNPAEALRDLRGTLDESLQALTGQRLWQIAADTAEPNARQGVYQASARLIYQGQAMGHFGVASPATLERFGLQTGVVMAELDIDVLIAAYPPASTADQLSHFPGTSRDLSVIVEEALPWSAIESQIHLAQLALLESVTFLMTYRGKPIAPGHKSVSFRMTFRDPAATLRHEQVEPQVEQLVTRLKKELHAELRS